MSTYSSSAPPTHAAIDLEQAFKQFTLETERLEMAYNGLQARFQSVQQTVQESNTRLSGKLAELDFTSRYLETILDNISQGILFIDLNGVVTTYNAAAQRILEVPLKSLLFRPFHDSFDDQVLGFSLQQALLAKECPSMTSISFKRGGETLDVEVEATFVSMSLEAYPLGHRDASSPPIQGLLLLMRDTTALRQLQRLANHHDRLKDLGELAAHLAHEIRNPLGGIKGFATILEQDLKERPDLKQMASYIAQGADELNKFVSNVLEYARPFKLHLESIDVGALIEEVRQLMQADLAWSDRISFEYQLGEAEVMIPLDPHHFKSALLNIFVNAVQAMPDGGRLAVAIHDEKKWVVITIEDTGVGIPPENLTKIFSPFFTTKESGNGLGLAEVHKVIQEHQGVIEVESEVGKGTKFIIKMRKQADVY